MPKWQVILIASLAAVCVVGVIALLLIWQLCGKKYGDYVIIYHKCACSDVSPLKIFLVPS